MTLMLNFEKQVAISCSGMLQTAKTENAEAMSVDNVVCSLAKCKLTGEVDIQVERRGVYQEDSVFGSGEMEKQAYM